MPVQDSKANMTYNGPNPDHPGGTKVKHDDSAAPIRENPGSIASDSLAAESIQTHGAFSENRNAELLGVTGSNSTFANRNTLGAVTLEPTDVAALRDNQDEKYETIADMGHKNPTEEKLKGRNLERKVDLKNYHHGPGPMDSVLADNGNPAPHYVDPVTKGVDLSGGSSAKMHGKNISQIGSDERFPGEGTGKKGLRMDEDREAIRNLETSNANRDAGGEGINNSYAGKDGGRFDALSDDVDV